MSTTLPIALVAGLVAGGVGAFATTALIGGAPKPQQDTKSAALDPAGDLEQQLRSLTEANGKLLERLDRLEASVAMGVGAQVRMPASIGNEPVDLEALIASAVAKLNTSPSGGVVTPDFRKQVETVLEIRAEEERLAREQERIAREAQQLEDRLARLQTDLGLDNRQVDGMRKVFLDSDAKRAELRDAMRGSRDVGAAPDFETMRTQWQSLSTAMDTQIASILTPSQYEQYKATNPDRGFGGRGDFGGGPGGVGGNTAGGPAGGNLGRGGRGGRGGNGG